MYGHEPLIEFRKAGKVPSGVWIDAGPVGTLNQAQDWSQWIETRTRAQIQIEPADRIERLDFRWAFGLDCWVDGEDPVRVRQVRDACVAAGAIRVMTAALQRIGEGEFVTFRLIEATDTAGEMVYPLEVEHHG